MDVLLVDDHPVIHEVMRGVVRAAFDGATLHAVDDLPAALARARSLERLDLALVDLGLPDCNGIEALTRFHEAFPDVPAVILSAKEDGASVRAALEAGAVGFIPKTSLPNVIVAALRLIAEGGIYVPPEALQDLKPARPLRLPPEGAGHELTERQLEVLRLLVRGRHYRQIARELGISENTVRQHARAIYGALGVASRSEALLAALRRGIRVGD